MSSVRILLTAVSDIATANELAERLIEKKLAACVQISSPITSFYRWEGKTQKNQEFQVWIKTSKDRETEAMVFIRKTHPYQLPEILSIPVHEGLKEYVEWVEAETK